MPDLSTRRAGASERDLEGHTDLKFRSLDRVLLHHGLASREPLVSVVGHDQIRVARLNNVGCVGLRVVSDTGTGDGSYDCFVDVENLGFGDIVDLGHLGLV